jgi:pimeloyl-ACP methyl ester carboxylesterase
MCGWDADADSRFAVLDGLRVHYKRAGQGPTVLLLHGSASSVHSFERVAAVMAAWFDVIRPDIPGFGLTGPRADRDYRVPTYASTVARLMRVLDVHNYAVVGNSLGGNIARNLALDYPGQVDAMVLINATGYPDKSLPAGFRLARGPLLRTMLRRWIPRAATARGLRSAVGPGSTIVDSAMVDRAHALMSRPGNRSAFVDVANTNQPDRSAEIPGMAVPTLVLRSAMIDGQHFARDIPGSRELIHPDGGRLLPEEDPRWVADAVIGFFNAHLGDVRRANGRRQ